MRHLTSSIMLVLMICLAATLSAQQYEGQKGDVNYDGAFNILDVVKTVRSILGLGSLDAAETWRADCNSRGWDCRGDGEVDIFDVAKIVNLILQVVQCFNTTVADVDGNVYYAIRIGTQEWMAENLRVTHYRNGDPIQEVTGNSQWSGLSTGAFCSYDDNPSNEEVYGLLYNWDAVNDSRSIAPEGWHVPSDAEWKQLEIYLGMSQSQAEETEWRGTDEGGRMKDTGTIEAGTGMWYSPNTGATNSDGFSALPAGHRNDYGYFNILGYYAIFWSATEYRSHLAWYRALGYLYSGVNRGLRSKDYGFSVRCLRD